MSTHITNNRDEALIAGYSAAVTTPELLPASISFLDMKNNLSDWDIKAIERNGKAIGMAVSKGGECHFCIKPKYQGKWLTKGLIKEVNEKVDCRFTTVNIKNLPKQRFVEKMGFSEIDMVGDNIVYQLKELKYGY